MSDSITFIYVCRKLNIDYIFSELQNVFEIFKQDKIENVN